VRLLLCEINMFENLTNKFEEIFSSLKKAPSLDEAQVDEGLRGIRQALLEADVSLDVAKDFIEKVKPKALGQEIIRSTSPGDMVVKIVYDELVDLLGATNNEINLNAVPPVPMMLVGLQGSGKTTTTAKLAKFLENIFKNYIKEYFRYVVILFFGLLHGLGFALVLNDIGYRSTDLFINLFSFNIGIEVAQISIVLVLYLFVALNFAKNKNYKYIFQVPSHTPY